MKLAWLAPLAAVLVAGCPTTHLRPTGPPPEYEKPVLPAWEAAAPANPLDNLGQGAWVDETGDQDAGADGATEATAPAEAAVGQAGAQPADAAASSDAGAPRPPGRKPRPTSRAR